VENKKSARFSGILLTVWAGFAVAAYFVSHKPVALQVLDHLGATLWALSVTSLLTINAFSLGRFTIKKLTPEFAEEPASMLLAGGIGLGELGLLGFGLAATRQVELPVLLGIQLLILAVTGWYGIIRESYQKIKGFIDRFVESGRSAPRWMKPAAMVALIVTSARTLLPPIEAFDALLYHLRVPELWIQDGGLQAYNIPHYWFPGLVEGVYFWGLGMNSEITSQQIHCLWAVLLVFLVWQWARELWGEITAWWSLMLLISMPSFLLLASWAYTDMALSFYGMAMLYCLWAGKNRNDSRLWLAGAVAAGMAMGVKYTSFVMPVSAVIMIAYWRYREPTKWMPAVAQFSLVSLLTGAVWYLRNWVWVGNPFYPFVFGGKYWDSFRAAAFSGAGSGIGWDFKAIVSLPLTITLGYQDANYFDGNIGPLFLLSLPLAILVFMRWKQYEPAQRTALEIIGFFTLLSVSFWTFGYISTKNLWQTRLLLPALIPFTIPAAMGLVAINQLGLTKFRASFIVTALAAMAIFINLLDATFSAVARNPLGISIGTVTKENYFERYQAGYFHALKLISETPAGSSVYSLFEPRSYKSTRQIQPDTILDNFLHDFYLHKTPEEVIKAWRAEGYTHVLLNRRGAEFIYRDIPDKSVLDATIQLLSLHALSPTGEYALYEIP